MNSNNKIRYILKTNSYSFMYSVECICDDVVVSVIKDVTPDKNKAELFCNFLNENMISPVHLYDVFEEYFYG